MLSTADLIFLRARVGNGEAHDGVEPHGRVRRADVLV